MKREQLRAGVDVGSTTAKLILLDQSGTVNLLLYQRHNSDIVNTLSQLFEKAASQIGECAVDLSFTGTAGMGIAERINAPFVQEVIAAGEVARHHFPDARMLIDIGGEDSKMMFFSPDKPPDIRMNGSCAGGTGAFIDRMATLLNLSIQDLDELAKQHKNIYPIASRCGVFAKTDVQNLVSNNVDLPDICASILQAVALQNLSSLARGIKIQPKILFCGGPLTFLSSLRESFCRSLNLSYQDIILPSNGLFFPAWGAVLITKDRSFSAPLGEWNRRIRSLGVDAAEINHHRLAPLFVNEDAYHQWERDRMVMKLTDIPVQQAEPPLFLGIDCGSTTTKVMVIDSRQRVVFSDYRLNCGNPIDAVMQALMTYRNEDNVLFAIAAGKATGYGEDLISAAFNLDGGVVETMAHWRAAVQCNPDVSFILDIGGQDMKALFIKDQAINRIEINEACSSGCGSFVEGFARSLGLTAGSFAEKACHSPAPCDLGTRCTVFMGSRIKQAQRENASIGDIAAGLAYAVIKNSLYKVLKLRDPSELGPNIMVQGGTFRNPAVLRAFEMLTGLPIASSDRPEMMGAYGAALLAKEAYDADPVTVHPFDLSTIERCTDYQKREIECHGCTNRCGVSIFSFSGGRRFFTGNKCERHFGNSGGTGKRGINLFTERNRLLFEDVPRAEAPMTGVRIGIPRILEMYETFPFWSTLLAVCGFDVVLSDESNQALYEKGLGSVMADNICFPAKLAHGHVMNLIDKGVDRILYPLTIYEAKEDAEAPNSYNCPIVASYAEVLIGCIATGERTAPHFDAPAISFRDKKLLKRGCLRYLKSLKVLHRRAERAFRMALAAQELFHTNIENRGYELLERARKEGRNVIVLAGRPYHADPFIEHQTSEMLADLGTDVLPCDAASRFCQKSIREIQTIPQWAFPNRLMKAAQWVANQPERHIQYVMLNSFGCGPDAFIMDEIRDILSAAGKIFTLIKIDEISSIGSVRLRLRSLIETLKRRPACNEAVPACRHITPPFLTEDRTKQIIAPYFADCYSPFFSPIFRLAGYNLTILPPSDRESVEYGLRYANNEICYPAIVIIGDIVKAFKQGRFDPEKTAVGMTQTGGQCRATNYVALIKKALISAGYPNTPVIAVAKGDDLINDQPGFELALRRIIKPAFTSLLYADAIARMYYKTVVRQRAAGLAEEIRDHYLELGGNCVERNDIEGMMCYLREAVNSFNDALGGSDPLPRIGIVGEIFLKYNRFGQMNVLDWMIAQGVEVVVPSLTDFAMQFFVNAKENRHSYLERGSGVSKLFEAFLESQAARWIHRFEAILAGFNCYEPSTGIYGKSRLASQIVSLSNQFGEGWLIPAEVADFARNGIYEVVCLQPFGCIANQVVAKGIESRIKRLYPMVTMLFLDFDASTSEVNILNRLHFMIDNARYHMEGISQQCG